MQLPNPNARLNGFITFVTFVLVVVILKVASEVLIPIALTILLTFLLTPMVVRLTHWGVPKAIAIFLTSVFALTVIGGVGTLVFMEGGSVAQDLPNYEKNIEAKIVSLRPASSRNMISRLNEMTQRLRQDLDKNVKAAAAPSPLGSGGPKPVPVTIMPHDPTAVDVARNILEPIIEPVGTAVIVAVFVITMLFQREDLRDRFIKVVSSGRLNLATQALEDAAHRVTRYLLMQLFVNTCYGVPIGVMLYLIGIPHAVLWGVLSTLLRFIPFIGPWIAACFPVALAAAVDPGWSKLFYTFGIYLGMEIITPNVIEPWLYGASTGISNLALLVAAVFWTWLWGTPGLFLSTPLTVCIMVLGKHVPGLQFLSVLLGSEPVLDPAARFYQRMLSMDANEMLALASEFIRERSLEEFYNDVFVPALYMSEQDRHSGTLAEVRQKFIFETSRELIEQLERDCEKAAASQLGPDGKPMSLRKQEDDRIAPPVVYGMAGRDDADEVVALMLQHLLRIRGMETEVIPVTVHAEDYASWIQRNQVKVAYISALPPSALVGARQLVLRLRESCPDTKVVVGVWDREADFDELTQRLRRPRPHAIVTNLGDAVRQIEKLLTEKSVTQTPESDDERAAEEAECTIEKQCRELQISPLGLIETDADDLMETVTRDLALHFNVPISLITISANEEPFWKARFHVPPQLPVESRSEAVTNDHLLPEEPIIVEDITKDRRFAATSTLTERGVRFYAGVPLRNRGGRLVGGISVVDTKPRAYNERDKQILTTRAAEFMEAVEALDADVQPSATRPPASRSEPSPAEHV